MLPPPPFKLPFRPRRIVVFAGHIVDTPDRHEPRFAPSMAARAGQRIGEALATLGLGPSDCGLTQGAAGGDILFGESCLSRRVPLQLLLPLPEDDFIAASISPSIDGDKWLQRYRTVVVETRLPPCTMPQAPGDKFERCNAWMLATAAMSGAQEIRLVCLWDGAAGDGPGGTAHMIREVGRLNGQVTWIDTRLLV